MSIAHATSDTSPLTSLLINISTLHFTEFFNTQPLPSIDWGIPPSTSAIHGTSAPASRMECHADTALNAALSMVREAKWSEAAQVLRPLVSAGDPDAEQLLILVLKQLQTDWQPHAQRNHSTMLSVPASAYDAKQNRIILHRYLGSRNAPRYVLVYLIFHECARLQQDAINTDRVTSAFLSLESCAPQRSKAQEWLTHHGFPVFQLMHERAANEHAGYFQHPVSHAWRVQ